VGRAPEICPNCGAEVPEGARACPGCGSDEQTGWSEAAETSGLDLPDPEFNYEEFVKKEFGREGPAPRGIHWGWWLVAIALVLAFLLFWFR
jgi:zinc-ribbon domain